MKGLFFAVIVGGFAHLCPAAFDGQITVTVTRGGETFRVLYPKNRSFVRLP